MKLDLWQNIKDLLLAGINEVIEWMTALQDAMGNLMRSGFFIEQIPIADGTKLSPENVSRALTAMYLIAIILLALKLVWKGFKVWILWRDGDSDTSPWEMFQHSVYALIVALAFPMLYEIVVNIVMQITMKAAGAIGGNPSKNVMQLALILLWPGYWESLGFVAVVMGVVYIVVFIIISFQVLKRGVEMLIFRLGVPLAVAGLVDSDGGIWKTYLQIFIQQLIITAIQDFLLRFSIALITAHTLFGMLLAVIFVLAAFSVPKTFAARLTGGSGGSGGGSVGTALMAARMFIKK